MRPEHLALFRQPSRPSVHLDGGWAVLSVTRPDLEDDTYPSSLWRLDIGSGALTPLTHGTSDRDPVLSPDGRWIAFVRGGKGVKPQLAIMGAAGGEPRVLTDHPLGVSGRPVFSPDGGRIAYTSRIPEQGRYGTKEGVGPDAEPPRLITDFSYRNDGTGFTLDRPEQVFVIDVPPLQDPTADVPRDEKKEDDDEGSPSGAVAATGVAPVQVTGGPLGHVGPVWLDDDALLVRRDIVDALGCTLVRHAATAGSEGTEITTPGHGPDDVALAPDGSLYLLVTDLGDDGMDFIGKSSALYRATLADDALVDVERLTDPTSESLTGAVFEPTEHGVLLTRGHRGSVELVRYDDGGLQVVLEGDREVYGAEPVGDDGAVLVAATGVGSLGDLVLVGADGDLRELTTSPPGCAARPGSSSRPSWSCRPTTVTRCTGGWRSPMATGRTRCCC